MFFNQLSGVEYTGQNVATLMDLGFEEGDTFVTFRQALKLPGMSGKKMKGMKKCATLVMYKLKEDPENPGRFIKAPKWFGVFDAKEVMARAK